LNIDRFFEAVANDFTYLCSYANLITLAINSSSKKKMTLNEIYKWICGNYPYYNEAGNGWKVNEFLVCA